MSLIWQVPHCLLFMGCLNLSPLPWSLFWSGGGFEWIVGGSGRRGMDGVAGLMIVRFEAKQTCTTSGVELPLRCCH
jgi:hypothetical protein